MRRAIRQFKSRRRRKRIRFNLNLRRLQRPGQVVDFAATDALIRVDGVKAITLGEELFERVGLGQRHVACGAVAGGEAGEGGTLMVAVAVVVETVAHSFARHTRFEVRQVKERAGRPNGEGAVGVERKEPDAGLVAIAYVGAQIQLGKVAHLGQAARVNVRHRQRHHADPRFAFKRVDLQIARYQIAQRRNRQRPMGEEQVAPLHTHDPRG